MKIKFSIVAICLFCACLTAQAGFVDTSGLDTNAFVVNKSAGTVGPNTNSANPKALSTKGDTAAVQTIVNLHSNEVVNFSNDVTAAISGKAGTNAFWGSVRLVHPNGTATNFYASTAALRGTAITQAQALATSGDTIYVFGDAVVSNSLGKDGVNWQLGAITLSAITNVNLFMVSNMTFSVSGQANLYATNASVFDSSSQSTGPSFVTINCRSAISFGPDSGQIDVFDIDNGETGGEWVINASELIQAYEEDALFNGGFADVTVTCPVIVASHDVFNNFADDGCTLRVRAIQLISTFDGSIIATTASTNFISADSAAAPGIFINSTPIAGSMIRVPYVQCATVGTSAFASGTNRFDGNWADGKISTSGTNIFSGLGTGITNHSDLTVGTTNTLASRKEVAQIANGLGIGSGTVTSVNVAEQGYSSSGAITTSGTVTLTQNADKNHLGFSETNINKLAATNSLIVGGPFIDSTNVLQVNTPAGMRKVLVNTNGDTFVNGNLYLIGNMVATTNQLLDASTLGANSHVKTGSTTNLISSEDANGYTNTVSWAHDGTATNITATFTGTLQSYTVTNGPDVFFGYAGANGSVSYRYSGASFATLHFSYQPKWISGSNNVITNGVLSLTSYGGTNATQIEAALKENQ